MLKTLTAEVQHYKSEIDDLDLKLAERRQAFLFADDLNEALASSPITGTTPAHREGARTPNQNGTPAPKDALGSANRLGTPSRQALAREVLTPNKPSLGPSSTSSPLGDHIASTQRKVQTLYPIYFNAPPEAARPDSSSSKLTSSSSQRDPDDVFGSDEQSSTGRHRPRPTTPLPKEISLSHLLTNIMVFEEFVKELTAIVQTRRAFDDVRFV